MAPDAPPALLDLPVYAVRSGRLCFMQVDDHIPFAVDAVTWSRQSSSTVAKEPDAWHSREAVVVALSGSLVVRHSSDGQTHIVELNRADQRLHIRAGNKWGVRPQTRNGHTLIAWAMAQDAATARTDSQLTSAERAIDPRRSRVDDCGVVQLARWDLPSGPAYTLRLDPRASLTVRRVYYLTDIPQGARRGGHAHRELYQYVVAARGSFEVDLDDGVRTRSIRLSRQDRALRLVPGIWRELRNFSVGSICLVMASERYDEADYLRRYRDFKAFKAL